MSNLHPTSTAATAAEAYTRYHAALMDGALAQNSWHSEEDGRQLACALGVLGPNVASPSDCPASVMPRWLAQMVPWFFDGQKAEDAFIWGEKFYEQLARLNGIVPFSVIHDWHANVVGPLAIEVATKQARNVDVHKALADQHAAALAGEKFSKDDWHAVLKPAFKDADAAADAYANVYADVDADADANAYAYSNVYANADADAYAYVNVYVNVYADVDAYAYVYANAALKSVADAMVECLARVPVATA